MKKRFAVFRIVRTYPIELRGAFSISKDHPDGFPTAEYAEEQLHLFLNNDVMPDAEEISRSQYTILPIYTKE